MGIPSVGRLRVRFPSFSIRIPIAYLSIGSLESYISLYIVFLYRFRVLLARVCLGGLLGVRL